jgi:hypothetical protein
MAWTTPGTATAGEVLTAAFWNTQVRDNSNELAPFFAAWTSFTPTLTNVTVGNGVHDSAYLKIGRLIIIRYSFTLGSTSSVAGAPVFSLPVGVSLSGMPLASQCLFVDAGGLRYPGVVEDNLSLVVCQAVSTSGSYAVQVAPTATIPFTWATGDKIIVGITAQTTT